MKKNFNKILFESPSLLSGEESEIRKVDFEFEKKLGQGAFGTVWKVRHKTTKEIYALKQVPKDKVQKMQSQFRREVYIMYNLNHSHIAKLYNHFEDEKSFYLIMEFCEGGNLFQKLSRQKSFLELEAAHYIHQVLLAVGYLHSHVPAIIHRDIKPENILLDKQNNVKLTDFGWSNYYTSSEEPRTTVCGTPEYLPPEMVERRTHDTSADVWCVGVLLYEMLTGYTPFRSQARNNMLLNISKCKPKFPLAFPVQAKDLIGKILVKNSGLRLGVKEILQHPWLKVIPDFCEKCEGDGEIVLPQFNGEVYVDKNPVFKFYRIIGEVKKIERDTLSTYTCDPPSTRRSNHNEDSSMSELSLSDSEFVSSESEISNDMLEDIACKESIRAMNDRIELSQKSVRLSKAGIQNTENLLQEKYGKIKFILEVAERKKYELENLVMSEDKIRDQLKKAEDQVVSLKLQSGYDEVLARTQEAKEKNTVLDDSVQQLRKLLENSKENNEKIHKNLSEAEGKLENTKKELENLKTKCSTSEILLIPSENSISPTISPEDTLIQELSDDLTNLMNTKISSLQTTAKSKIDDHLCVLLDSTKKKCAKLEKKIKSLKLKYTEKKYLILENYNKNREKIENLQKIASQNFIQAYLEQVKTDKSQLRLELQAQRIDEQSYPQNHSVFEKTYAIYQVITTQELKFYKEKVYNNLKKIRSAHFDCRDKKRKLAKQILIKSDELKSLKQNLV